MRYSAVVLTIVKSSFQGPCHGKNSGRHRGALISAGMGRARILGTCATRRHQERMPTRYLSRNTSRSDVSYMRISLCRLRRGGPARGKPKTPWENRKTVVHDNTGKLPLWPRPLWEVFSS